MLLVYIYVALAAYNTGYLTLGLNNVETIIDEAANVAVLDGQWRQRVGQQRGRQGVTGAVVEHVKEWREIWSQGTDAVMDVPLGGVCEVLYGDGRQIFSEDEDDEIGS